MSLFLTRNGCNDGKAYLFAPEGKFDIRFFAEVVVEVMRAAGVGARAYLPGDVVVDVEEGCPVEEIVDGYHKFMLDLLGLGDPCNQNKKGLKVICN